MGSFGIFHWIVVLVIVLVLFGGRGKIQGIMGDFAQGINAFKKGIKDPEAPKPIDQQASRDTDKTSA